MPPAMFEAFDIPGWFVTMNKIAATRGYYEFLRDLVKNSLTHRIVLMRDSCLHGVETGVTRHFLSDIDARLATCVTLEVVVLVVLYAILGMVLLIHAASTFTSIGRVIRLTYAIPGLVMVLGYVTHAVLEWHLACQMGMFHSNIALLHCMVLISAVAVQLISWNCFVWTKLPAAAATVFLNDMVQRCKMLESEVAEDRKKQIVTAEAVEYLTSRMNEWEMASKVAEEPPTQRSVLSRRK
jgi:hypothetical protein